MTPIDLKSWRSRLSLTQAEAAARLGVSLPQYRNLERGSRPDRPSVTISRTVELAARAIEAGLDTR